MVATMPNDTVLLLHGMMLMSDFKDGQMSPVFDAYVETIPELAAADITELKQKVSELRLSRPSKDEWVKVLAEISSEAIKQKTLVLAIDIAMASGGMVEPEEDDLLDAVRQALGIDLVQAEKIVDVLSLKYAT
jgi:hypothetical protein